MSKWFQIILLEMFLRINPYRISLVITVNMMISYVFANLKNRSNIIEIDCYSILVPKMSCKHLLFFMIKSFQYARIFSNKCSIHLSINSPEWNGESYFSTHQIKHYTWKIKWLVLSHFSHCCSKLDHLPK